MKQTTEPNAAAPSEAAVHPDPTWTPLYRMGAISVLLYIILGILIPMGMLVSVNYNAELSGVELLNFIAGHRIWWAVLQHLVMGTAVLPIVAFAALGAALKHLDKNMLLAGVLLGISSQILYLAYFPVVNGLAYMSDQYAAAANPSVQEALASGAEALVAQNNAYGPSEAIMALGILMVSVVMRKGVFHRAVAYVGIAAFPAAVIGAAFKSTLGITYLWWWLVVVIWFIAVGIKLYQLGWPTKA